MVLLLGALRGDGNRCVTMGAASILIVDDNPVNLGVLRGLLSRDDYDLVAAKDGESALDIVRANPTFDLILLDVFMPGINGIEVCRRLKEDPNTAPIPIVLVSAHLTDEASIREGLAAGAEGYLTKPIEDVALRAWVKATLRISSLQRKLFSAEPPEKRPPAQEVMERFARLSHAVNNPLQALYAAADLLSLDLEENESQQALVRDILANAERVAQIVAEASLLAKSRLPG